MASETGINGAAGAEDGEEKAVCIGLPHKVHTVPGMSVRLRVALYFVNISPQGNKSFCAGIPHNNSISVKCNHQKPFEYLLGMFSSILGHLYISIIGYFNYLYEKKD